MTVTTTAEQIGAAFLAWDKLALDDPEHFADWDEEIGNDPLLLAEFFIGLLTEQGAVTS